MLFVTPNWGQDEPSGAALGCEAAICGLEHDGKMTPSRITLGREAAISGLENKDKTITSKLFCV